MIVTDLSNSFNPCPKNTIKEEKKKSFISLKPLQTKEIEEKEEIFNVKLFYMYNKLIYFY